MNYINKNFQSHTYTEKVFFGFKEYIYYID